VFDAIWNGEAAGDQAPDAIIEQRGLKQISDSGALEGIVDQVLAANAQQVADYRSGKEKAFNSLVGQVMKATRGKANPQQVNAILKSRLSGEAGGGCYLADVVADDEGTDPMAPGLFRSSIYRARSSA
jgi:aspartyl-tRNA(Asn)/glutamyl-tRNA(Gln) amidotransferase subunit B